MTTGTTIDKKVIDCGASNVSYEYVCSKLLLSVDKESQLYASIPSNYGVNWTSYRQVTNVNGTLFEIQVITGIPNTSDSPLMNHSLTYPKTSNDTIQAVSNLVFSVVSAGTSNLPVISTIITGIDLAKAAYGVSTVGSTVTVSGVNCAALTSCTTTMKLVYVKHSGAPDSNQICMYLGNSTYCNTAFTVGYNKKNADGSFMATNKSISKSFTVTSAGFMDYNSMCWKYHLYKYYGTEFESYYFVYSGNLYYKIEKNGNIVQKAVGKVNFPLI